MKNLLQTVLAVALVSSSFTSCVENEVPEEVKAIYVGQANLLTVKAAFIAAETAHENAIAAHEEAEAENQRLINEQLEAINAVDLEVAIAASEALILEAALNAEKAKMDLEVTTKEFEREMFELEQSILNLKDEVVTEYFDSFIAVNDILNSLRNERLNLEQNLIESSIDQIIDNREAQVLLAEYANDLAEKESEKAALETKKAELEALLADPSLVANEEKQTELEAIIDANTIEIEALSVSIEEKDNEIEAADAVLDELNGAVNGLKANYDGLKSTIDTQIGIKDAAEDSNESLTSTIEDKEAKLASYDAEKAALETALANAASAKDAADTAAENAQVAKDEADDQLTILDDNQNNISNDLNVAADAYTTKLNIEASYDVNLANATANQGTSQAEYDAAKILFEANPTKTTWELAGFDGYLADHGNGSTRQKNFRQILSVTITNSGSAVVLGDYNGRNTPSANDYTGFLASAQISDEGKWYDVGADDVDPGISNLARFQAASSDLEFKNDALEAATIDEEDFTEDLVAAKAEYDRLAGLFADAQALAIAQQDIVDANDETLAAAITASNEANNDFNEADTELNTFNSTSKRSIEDAIEQAKVDMGDNDIKIGVAETEIAELQVEIDEILARIEAGTSDEAKAAQEAVNALRIEKDNLETEKSSLETLEGNLEDVISAIGSSSSAIQIRIDEAQDRIGNIQDVIESKQDDITRYSEYESLNAESIKYYTLELEILDSRIELYTTKSDKYKSLLESVL